jgi:hypothetical protein
MDTTTLVIAVVGLVLSVASLVWQAASFRLSGPRVKVHLREGFRGPLGVMVAPPSVYTDVGRAALVRQGYTEHVLVIEAVNKGRLAATVNNWSLRFGNRAVYENPTDPGNPALPHRLESYTSATWTAPVENLEALQDAFDDQGDEAATVRADLKMADRRTVTSREAIVVQLGSTRALPRRRLARRLARIRRQPHG